MLLVEPSGPTHMWPRALNYPPGTTVDIYKLQQSPLIEEHMFLLFCPETPPHDVQAPPPLKGSIVY